MRLVRVCDVFSGDNRYAKTHERQFQNKHCKKLAREKNQRHTESVQGPKGTAQILSRIQNTLAEPFQNKQKYCFKHPTDKQE